MWYRKRHVAEKFRYHIGNSDTTSVFSDTTSEIISNRVECTENPLSILPLYKICNLNVMTTKKSLFIQVQGFLEFLFIQ
jgi:hypothetical protein